YTDTETAPGNTYAYRVKAVGENSQSEYSNEASITIEQKNGINKISQQHDLAYNYPNPFNSQTTIHFMLNENSDIEFSVYNSTGVLIQRLQGRFNAGDNEFRFDGSNLARGTYQYILQSNTKTSTGKMMID
ncbi:MAG: T9SS type A sorting domain-containing protein, partial [Prolixibacteraceae bacterium]|nr:T9SS type A sorting domain-containing protein [Prolixibacteraceae bacterium]